MLTAVESSNILHSILKILSMKIHTDDLDALESLPVKDFLKQVAEQARKEFTRDIQADIRIPYWIWKQWSKSEAGRFVQDVYLDAKQRVERVRAIVQADFIADKLANGSEADFVMAEITDDPELRDDFINHGMQKELAAQGSTNAT